MALQIRSLLIELRSQLNEARETIVLLHDVNKQIFVNENRVAVAFFYSLAVDILIVLEELYYFGDRNNWNLFLFIQEDMQNPFDLEFLELSVFYREERLPELCGSQVIVVVLVESLKILLQWFLVHLAVQSSYD